MSSSLLLHTTTTTDERTIVVAIATTVTAATIPSVAEAHMTTIILGYRCVTPNLTPTITIVPWAIMTVYVAVAFPQAPRTAGTLALRPAAP